MKRNSKRRVLTAFVLALVCASILFGQAGTSVNGRVIDPQGAGVPGALVTLYLRGNNARTTVTADESGAYRFTRLAPGEYIVDVQAYGFAATAGQSVRLERGKELTVDIPLRLAGVAQVVVVTASGAAQPVDEVSKAISVVSRQEMDERDEFAVSEALRTVPGLRVQQLGGPGAFTSIKTRGLRNEDTAVLIDGLRFRDVNAPQGDASGYLADLVVTQVDRVEVLRGSGSSLYGTNAIGGVINVVTDAGGGRTRGNLLLEGGALGLFRGRGQLAGGFKQDRINYSAGLVHLNVSKGVDGDDAARNTSGQGRVSFRLSPTATLSARLYAVDSFLQLNTSPQGIGTLPAAGIIKAVPLSLAELHRYETGAPVSQLNVGSANFIPSADNPDWSRPAHFFTGAVTFEQRPTDDFGYTITYQGLSSYRSFRDGPAGVSFQPAGNTRSDSSGSIQTLLARMNFRLGRFQFIHAGYEFENENFVNRSFPVNPAGNSAVDVTQRSNTLHIQDQLRLMDNRLQISTAFRAQFFSLKTPQFTPAASAPYRGFTFEAPPNAYTGDGSVAYHFSASGTKVRAHVGNGYRAPSLFERFGASFGSFGYSVFGDPRLRPDRSLAVDAGLDQDLFNHRLRASATYFYTRLQEVIVFDFSGAINPATDPFGRFGGYRNTRGGLARGLELGVTLAPLATTDISIAYTYTNADRRAPVIKGLIRSLVIPNHQFSVVATQRVGRRFFVNLDLTASSDYLAPIFDPVTFASRAYAFKGIVKTDLGVSYRMPLSEQKSIRFFGKVENLFDRTYFENGFRTPGATAVGGLQLQF